VKRTTTLGTVLGLAFHTATEKACGVADRRSELWPLACLTVLTLLPIATGPELPAPVPACATRTSTRLSRLRRERGKTTRPESKKAADWLINGLAQTGPFGNGFRAMEPPHRSCGCPWRCLPGASSAFPSSESEGPDGGP